MHPEQPINESRLLSLFEGLCSINSPSLKEKEVGEFIKLKLAEHDIYFYEDGAGAKIGGDGNNIICKASGNMPGAPSVFLSAHMDTVEPTQGIQIVFEDGIFRTNGTTILGADDKAGVACAIEALVSLIESNAPHGEVYLLLSVSEEIGLKGASVIDLSQVDVDFGFVLDTGPPVGSYVVRTATHDKIEVTVRGKPAHAGKEPELGIDAIRVAAEAIAGMKLGRIGPETTANLGLISGGSAVNVVSSQVVIRGEARSTSIDELDAQVEHMKEEFLQAANSWGATIEFKHERAYNAYEIGAEEEVVKVGSAASRNLGLDPILRTTLGGSDANIYNAKGIPTIVMGTGMSQIHTHSEFIKKDDLILGARLALEVLLEASRSSPGTARGKVN